MRDQSAERGGCSTPATCADGDVVPSFGHDASESTVPVLMSGFASDATAGSTDSAALDRLRPSEDLVGAGHGSPEPAGCSRVTAVRPRLISGGTVIALRPLVTL